MENLLNTLFEPICLICKHKGSFICPTCFKKCNYLTQGFCIVCEKSVVNGHTHASCLLKQPAPTQVFSAFIYEDVIRTCIKKSKYNPKLFAGLKRLSYEAAEFASKCGNIYSGHLVLPVPISKAREKERGFNQAQIITQIISKEFKLRSDYSILTRDIATLAQHSKNRADRFKSLKGVFRCVKSLNNEHILLVDDICTSGATLIEASWVLFLAGAASVSCFTLARRL